MVHLFTGLGKHFALDVGSGAVHMLSPDAYAVLSEAVAHGITPTPEYPELLHGVYPSKASHDAWNELHELYVSGVLFSEDRAARIELPKDPPLKAICLHVAHDCNLRCEYCFADTGGFGASRCRMGAETACRAVDYLISHSGARRNLEVDFFGGEPLLALDVVKETVAYARGREKACGKNFRFTLTTNGMLLDEETADYLNAEMSNIVLSLDGRREVNDALRRTVGGKGCYDVIAPRFQKLTSRRVGDWFVRGTFTARNLDFSNDVIHLADLGFKNISIEPVVLPDGHPLAIKEEHLDEICAEYDKLAAIMAQRDDFSFFHFNVDLNQGPCVYKRLRGCGAGCEYAAVTPDGGIYPCHQFAGREECRMGSVRKGEINPDIKRRFSQIHVHSRVDCADCWAKYHCGGGCSAANLNTMSDIDVPYGIGCVMERKRLECAIALKALK